MDSDRSPKHPKVNATKMRVAEEAQSHGGMCWITEGREIENYLPRHVLEAAALQMKGVSTPSDKRGQVLDPYVVRKTEFARLAVSIPTEEWPLDLKRRITEIVAAIRAAK